MSSLNKWRNYFRSASSDIFDIIDRAIMVAAADCPVEFKLRRDRIAERLFSCRLARCTGCDRVELAVPEYQEEDDDVDQGGRDDGGGETEGGASKESKVNSSRDENNVLLNVAHNQVSNYDYGLAEALNDEIEEESQVFEEVVRIKEVLEDRERESDGVLFDSLRRLQLMALSVETLKATEIGKAVNGLRKHGSSKIRGLARELIDGWKVTVDEWVNATAAVGAAPASQQQVMVSDCVDPSVGYDDEEGLEEGLPIPPLDEGAFFATQTATMELSQFFDGMDDYGNSNTRYGGPSKQRGRNPAVEKQSNVKQEKYADEGNALPKERKNEMVRKKQDVVVKPNKPSSNNAGPRRPPAVGLEQKGANCVARIEQKRDMVSIQKRQLNGQRDNFKCSDDAAVQVKLEATKRRLQESYQQAENVKRQRTIQVMELHDLPKQGNGRRNTHGKPGIHNRHGAHGRRF